jgi:hypothetical protein
LPIDGRHAVSTCPLGDGQRTKDRLGASWQWWRGGAVGAIGSGYRGSGKDNCRLFELARWRRGIRHPGVLRKEAASD